MFLDQASIKVIGGSGGRGCVSWRREAFVPKGGPDGGNGGNGGNVYLIADSNTDTLSAYASKKVFKAEIGHFGMGKNCNGKGGEDLLLPVPPGTLIKDAATGAILADLPYPGDQVLIAGGGRGGYGNAHFKSSTRQRPDFAELGEPGEEKKIALELKLVADVGIIGLPSVGKSTLIAAISSARPKIADYPFTTLIPNLGVVSVDDRSYVVCDVPGLIGGASEGKGLGIQFLRHIERCGVLLHLLDVSRALGEGNVLDPQVLLADYKTIRAELEAYSPTLSQKQELVLLNKDDLVASHTEEAVTALKKAGVHVFMSISAAAHSGTEELKKKLLPLVLSFR
ncbi:MAG: GTPase ObgE, partial [Candidatus Peribacteraceae bacterium]|nr:GTPase ObgE [Candidatus Peribacteraceae bacterium]